MAMTGGTAQLVKTTYPFSDSSKAVQLYVYYKTSQNVSNNTSTITCGMYVVTPSGWDIGSWSDFNGSYVGTSSLTFDGSIPNFSGTRWLVENKSFTVSHNSDGTGTTAIYWKWGVNSPWGGYQNPSGSFSITLPTIPRASSITSAGNVTLGNACNIKWTPASSSFKYKLKFSLSTWNYTTDFISPNTTSAYTYTGYTIPANETLYNLIPNSPTGTMSVTLTTYNSSGTQIGSTSAAKNFTVTVPSNVKPTFGTITLDPVNITTSDGVSRNILVQGKNKLNISVSGCSAGTGSSIKSYTFSGSGISYTGTSTSITSSNNINPSISGNSTTLTYTVTVTDNRNRSASKTATITCYAYTAPFFKGFQAYKVNESNESDENGNKIRCLSSFSWPSVNNTNSLSLKVMYKKTTDSAYQSITDLTNGNPGTGRYTNITSIDPNSTYMVYAEITDAYGGYDTSTIATVFGPSRIFNILQEFDSSGNLTGDVGIAVGKMAESLNVFDSRYKIKTPGLTSSRGTRPTNANITPEENYLGTMEYYLASNSMTSNKPSLGDGHVMHFHWDNTGGYDSQLYLHNSDGAIMSRGCNSGTWGSWRTNIDSANYTNYVSAKPITLYSTTTGNVGTITLSSSAANFTYIEIFYTDNNTRQPSCLKVYSPNGKYVSLSCIEPSTSGSEPRVYIRSSGWTISGTTMTPGRTDLDGENRGVYGQIYKDAGGTNIDVNVTAQNYIKIFRILGYA